MSSEETDDELDRWLRGLDAGRSYRESDAYLTPLYEQLSYAVRGSTPPGKSPRSDRPDHVSIPEERFGKVVKDARANFAEAVENEEVGRLRRLEDSLPQRLESLHEEVVELNGRIDLLDQIQDRFSELADQFNSLEEAFGERSTPDGVQEIEGAYSAVDLFQDEADYPVYKKEASPLKVAAHARLLARKVRRTRDPRRSALAVGRLRLRILKYVLSHFEITGCPPRKKSGEEIENEVQKDRQSATENQSKGGRPAKVAEGRDISERDSEINRRLESKAFYKTNQDGTLLVDWSSMKESIDDELFVDGDHETVRGHAYNSDNIDVKRQKEEMRKRMRSEGSE
jgi:hypothetical protein